MSVFYPWPVFRSLWACKLEDVELDGQSDDKLVDENHRRLRADQVPDWKELRFTVRAQTTELPPTSLSEIRPFVLMSSPRTQVRHSVPLIAEPATDGPLAFRGTLSVPRSMLAGAVQVRVDVGARHMDRRRVVGSSDLWTLVIDPSDAPKPPGAPPFKTAWIDFSSADAPSECRQRPGARALMNLNSAEPTMLLNDKLDGFRHLLLADGAKLERRRHRDLLGAELARYAVGSLFRAAVDELVTTDEDDPVEPPSTSLLRQVCEVIAETIFELGSVEELYEKFAHPRQLSTSEMTSLWAQVDLAIDALTDVSRTAAAICFEVKHV